MPKKSKQLRFQTDKKREASKTKHFVLGFLMILILFGTVSAVILFKDASFSSANSTTSETVTEQDTSTVPAVSGTGYYLVFCTDDENDKVRFASVIKAVADTQELTVCAVSPEESAQINGIDTDLSEAYEQGGAPQVVKLVEQIGNIKIKNYISANEEKFVKAFNVLGSIQYNVPEKVSFRSKEANISLAQGMQKMTGDIFYRYMLYCSSRGREGMSEQASVFGCAIDSFINKSNFNKVDRIYEKIINIVSSDISVIDFNNMKPALEAFSLNTMRPSCTEVSSLSELSA
ncbi:MAG: LCP family protein [Clostridiales bacterium]|nr:LCP family protein [Clostridiales bacterium]